jgi:mevalonate kinase
MVNTTSFFSNGKLMLTAEYFVLDGALSLALPTIQVQKLSVINSEKKDFFIHWQSIVQNEVWLDFFLAENFDITLVKGELEKAAIIQQLLKLVQLEKPLLLQNSFSYQIKIEADFPHNWGLGSSSTLIGNIAKWSGLNGFMLNEKIFGGSGYDIAVALESKPVLYQLENKKPVYKTTNIHFPFAENLFFVHLNQKQNSREGIAHYKQLHIDKQPIIQQLNEITNNIFQAENLQQFETLLNQHEDIIAQSLQLKKVKDLFFADYWGSVKSLGAWGGDFVLATSHKTKAETLQYFQQKGYETILDYKDIIFAT